MADIFNEIDEELRRDKAQVWWKQYGKYIIAVALIAVIAAGGYTWYEEQRKAELQALADQYDAAQQVARSQDAESARATFEALATKAGTKGIGLVARFQAAGLHLETGDHAAAAAAFDAIAQDGTVATLYRDLASVMAVMHGGMAGGDIEALRSRIEPLTGDQQPWRYTARMVAASLALGTGDRDAAREYLQRVADDADAPTSARGQATEILQAIGS